MKKIHRFITEYKKSGSSLEITDADIIHHIKDVLKLRHGEECIITNTDNIEYTATIVETDKKRIILDIVNNTININEPNKKVHLYLSILKKENFELVLQKASEMGINAITPIITTNTVKTNLNFERLNKIAREASELSGRSQVTKINDIVDFETAVKEDQNQNKVLFDITGENFRVRQDLTQEKSSIYIGPEGGFTDMEIKIAKDAGVQINNLGKLTLRGETAGIIACYLALN
jgi:16S rRNA (uracil1498-N3)-methyltransferase